jgi:hypothetical protein
MFAVIRDQSLPTQLAFFKLSQSLLSWRGREGPPIIQSLTISVLGIWEQASLHASRPGAKPAASSVIPFPIFCIQSSRSSRLISASVCTFTSVGCHLEKETSHLFTCLILRRDPEFIYLSILCCFLVLPHPFRANGLSTSSLCYYVHVSSRRIAFSPFPFLTQRVVHLFFCLTFFIHTAFIHRLHPIILYHTVYLSVGRIIGTQFNFLG